MIAGAVLAAGAGRRFGDAPKQLAVHRGRPLLQHALDAAAGARDLDPLLLVLGARAERVRAGVDAGRARVLVCDDWEEGMAASLRCAVAEVEADAEWLVVVLGDMPDVTSDALDRLAAAAREAPLDVVAVRTSHDGVPGHPVALRHTLFADLLALRGDRGARDLLRGARCALVEAGAGSSPFDVDTQEALIP